MPYDATPLSPIDRLIVELRGPEPVWWNFSGCQTCAMAVAAQAIGAPRIYEPNGMSCETGIRRFEDSFARFARFMRMPVKDARAIFLPRSPFQTHRVDDGYESIKARHVADALEDYVRTGTARTPYCFVLKERVR